MEGNSFTFNPRRYENHLSVFGRKVLNLLVHKWKSDQSGIQRSQHGYYRRAHSSAPNRIFLTFRDTEPPRHNIAPLPTFDQMNYDDRRDEPCIDFNFMETNISCYNAAGEADDAATPTTPTTSQALPAARAGAGAGGANISSCELINPVIEGHIPKRLFTEPTNNFNFNQWSDQINNADNENDVDWDNMFDTELLSSDTAEGNAQLVIEQVESPPSAFNIRFPRDNENNKENNRKNKTKGKAKDNERNKSKGKNPSPTDTIPKEVKKVSAGSKVSFRKQKYTKAVKNWLSSVEVHAAGGPGGEAGSGPGGARHNKKVVQAQLANKDGIMKFRKPNIQQTIYENPAPAQDNVHPSGATTETSAVDSSPRSIPEQSTPATNITTKKTPKQNKSEKTPVKDKKSKPKFVAPIKSQTPVKDEQHPITTVEASNIDRCMETISSGDDGQLAAVLLYRDGSCQLNKQHSGGGQPSEPHGFILNAGQHFYIIHGERDFSREALQTMLEKKTIVCYDGKSLLMYLKDTFEVDIHRLTLLDAMIGGCILEADRPPADFTQLQQLVSLPAGGAGDEGDARQQAARLCLQLRLVAHKLAQLIEEEQLGHVFYDIEMKLVPIIADMELAGVSVDSEQLSRMEREVAARARAAEDACHAAAGRAFQVTSPAQVRALVYEELALDRRANLRVRATLARHDKSTCDAMLRSLADEHPLPRLVLQYRHLHKAHATFLAGIAQHVTGGVLKPTWLQAAAATGRIACANPNLQAIPREPFSLHLFPEHAPAPAPAEHHEWLNLRAVYRARAGWCLLAADFRHLECRVFAHHAADRDLRAALHHSNDLFRLLAAKWYWLQKEEGEVSGSERERTKHVVYASLYGAGVRTLADILHVDYEHALAVYTSFNRCFPSLKRFGSAVVCECAAARGRLRSLAGRARRLPHIASPEPALRAQAERQALNFIVQGSAADLCKLAMVGASGALRAHRPALAARLLLQIHDELVWEVPRHHLHAAAVIIKRSMEECGLQSGMQDRLPVALSVGTNWGEMKPYHLE